MLEGKKGLIVGIANERSIAYGCARVMREREADLAITYLNSKAEPYVRPLAEQVGVRMIMPCDVQQPQQMEAVFAAIARDWGKLDFLIHSIAFAPKEDLHGRVTDCSLEGFLTAMDISCHSFLRMARLAEPLMMDGGSMMTVSYAGSHEVVPHYNMMGPVKAALESAVRYMAAELGGKNIRVNAISPGPIATRAAGGIEGFDALLKESVMRAPLKRLATIDDVGHLAAFLASDGARSITGGVHLVDAGVEIMG